jgi:hypothetical protein
VNHTCETCETIRSMDNTLKLKYMFYYLFHKSFLSFYHFDVNLFIDNHSKIFAILYHWIKTHSLWKKIYTKIFFSESDTSLREEWIENLRVLKFEKTYYFCYCVGLFFEKVLKLFQDFLRDIKTKQKTDSVIQYFLIFVLKYWYSNIFSYLC